MYSPYLAWLRSMARAPGYNSCLYYWQRALYWCIALGARMADIFLLPTRMEAVAACRRVAARALKFPLYISTMSTYSVLYSEWSFPIPIPRRARRARAFAHKNKAKRIGRTPGSLHAWRNSSRQKKTGFCAAEPLFWRCAATPSSPHTPYLPFSLDL